MVIEIIIYYTCSCLYDRIYIERPATIFNENIFEDFLRQKAIINYILYCPWKILLQESTSNIEITNGWIFDYECQPFNSWTLYVTIYERSIVYLNKTDEKNFLILPSLEDTYRYRYMVRCFFFTTERLSKKFVSLMDDLSKVWYRWKVFS